MKLSWWQIRYALHAMRLMRCNPKFAWSMATADDVAFLEGETPLDAFWHELECWSYDGDWDDNQRK